MPGEGAFKPFNSGEVPRYQEIATFIRAARAAIAPPLDPTGITCINAANLMFEILCLVAAARAVRRPGCVLRSCPESPDNLPHRRDSSAGGNLGKEGVVAEPPSPTQVTPTTRGPETTRRR